MADLKDDIAHNPYLALKISFDPPETYEEKISRQIKIAISNWQRLHKTDLANYFGTNSDTIVTSLTKKTGLQSLWEFDAREEKYFKNLSDCESYLEKGVLTPEEKKELADKKGLSEKVIEDWERTGKSARELYREFYLKTPHWDKEQKFDDLTRKVENFFDYLKIEENSPFEDFKDVLEKKYEEVRKLPPREKPKLDKNTLSSYVKIFSEAKNFEDYTQYRIYRQRKNFFDAFVKSSSLSSTQFNDAVEELKKTLPTSEQDKAPEIIKSIALVRDIKIPFEVDEKLLCKEAARSFFIDNDLSKAEQILAKVEKMDPHLPLIKKVRLAIQDQKDKSERVKREIVDKLDELEQMLEDKEIDAALKLYRSLSVIVSSSDSAVQRRYDKIGRVIEKIELARAKLSGVERLPKIKQLELCKEVYDIYPNLPELAHIIENALEPPKNFKVKCDEISRENILTWDVEPGFSYIICRSEQGNILKPEEKNILKQNWSGNKFIDKHIEAATEYYYNVFAVYIDNFSQGANKDTKPVVNYFTLKKSSITVSTLQDSVNLRWEEIPQGATVEISEELGNGGLKKIDETNLLNYTIKNLSRDQEYTFVLRCVYGEKKSAEQRIKATPAPLPEAVNNLNVRLSGDGSKLSADYESPSYGETILAWTKSKNPTHSETGKEFSKDKLYDYISETIPDKYKNSFDFPADDWKYICVVSISGSNAIIGKCVKFVKNISEPIMKSAKVENGKIYLTLSLNAKKENLPYDANDVDFKIVRRTDRIPQNESDGDIFKVETRSQTADNVTLVIEKTEAEKNYFLVFAVLKDIGIKSKGMIFIWPLPAKGDIYFSVEQEKKFIFFGDWKVKMEFFMKDNSDFDFPETVIIASRSGIPLQINEGRIIDTIPAKTSAKKIEWKSEPGQIRAGEFIKPFAKNSFDVVQFVPQSGNLKIG